MTPQGLPPITPSMPSFTFLPPPPLSPGLGSPYGEEMPYVAALGRRRSLVSSPRDESNLNDPTRPNDSSASSPPPLPHQQHPQQQPPTSPQAYHHIHHAHPPPPPIMSPYAPFSPGVTMSPGTFWGRPGGANPYINPAVGAPVHSIPQAGQGQTQAPQPGGFYAMPIHQGHGEYFPQFSPVAHVYPPAQAQYMQQYHEEIRDEMVVTEAGSYFPFVPPQQPASQHLETTTEQDGDVKEDGIGEEAKEEDEEDAGAGVLSQDSVEELTKGLREIAMENEVDDEDGADSGGKRKASHRTRSAEVAGRPSGISKVPRVLPRAGSDPAYKASGDEIVASSTSTTSGGECSGGNGHVGKRKPDLEIDVAKSKTEGWGTGRGI